LTRYTSNTEDFPTFQTYIRWLNRAIFTEKPDYNLTLKFISNRPQKRRLDMALFIGVLFVFLALIAYPYTARAGLLSFVAGFFSASADASDALETLAPNSQNMSLPKAVLNVNSNLAKSDQVPVIIDDTSLFAETDPNGNGTSTIDVFDSSQITIYVVRSGDTLPQIAKTFGITENTIKIANDMTGSKLKEGQRLIILPVSGVQHTIKSGETLLGIAKAYKITSQDILQYNYFENSSHLAVGDTIFIPSDSLPIRTVSSPSSSRTAPLLGAPLLGGLASSVKNLVNTVGYFIEPLTNYHKTQSLHGHNGVDLGAPVGTPILAAASGEVVISRMGWNGGYGNYVVIQHDNGTQTVYGHASKLLVTEGQSVVQGQKIALVGSSGVSTGPHLHVEVRGGKNPF
jgi:LysM repeat protein